MSATKIALLTIGVSATEPIAQYQAVSPAGGVAAAGANAIGFATTAAAAGDRCPVDAVGTTIAIAGGAIAAGAALEVGAGGKLVTKASGIAVARALAAATADQQLEVLLLAN